MYLHNSILAFLKQNKEINELYITTAIRAFSIGLIGIFIPIYLLNEGFSLSQVFLFFAIISTTHFLFTIPATRIAARWGFKHTILLSIPFLIVGYLMLYTLDIFGWPLWLIGILLGLENCLFWMSYHVDFAKFSTKGKRSSEVGMAKIAVSIFGFISPVVGSIILIISGFEVLFVVVSAFLLLSVVPLFFSEDLHTSIKVSWKEVFKKRSWREYSGFLGYGIESRAFLIIWPVFLFFTILGESFGSLGSITSLRLFSTLVFLIIIGKLSDNYKKLILKIGAILNLLIWVLKGFIGKPSQVFVADALHGGTQSMINVSLDVSTYDNANLSESIVHYIAFREMMFHLGAAGFLILMVFFSDLIFGFMFGGGLGSLLLFLF